MQRPCVAPRCSALVGPGVLRCPKHQREYDLRRGSSTQRGYNSPEHRAWRRTIILRDKLCVDCYVPLLGTDGEPVGTAHADHVIPLSRGGDYSLQNGAARCNRCHSRKTMREQRDPFLPLRLAAGERNQPKKNRFFHPPRSK